MDKKEREEKAVKLRNEIKALRKRLSEVLNKSNDLFSLGGDGWHDNSAYNHMVSDVDKIGAMIDEVNEELRELLRTKESGL